MKINTLTLKNIINEELNSVLLETKGKSSLPTPESLGFVLPQNVKNLMKQIDLQKLVNLVKKFRIPRTLEESEKQMRMRMRQRQRRLARQKAQELPTNASDIKYDDRSSEEIVTALTKLIKDKNDKFGSNTKKPEYQEGLQELVERYKNANDPTDKESLEKWIGMFQYAAQFPALKKQIPNIMDFIESRKEEVLNVFKNRKEKAREKWNSMSKNAKRNDVGMKLAFTNLGIGLINFYLVNTGVDLNINLGVMGMMLSFMIFFLLFIDGDDIDRIVQRKDRKMSREDD